MMVRGRKRWRREEWVERRGKRKEVRKRGGGTGEKERGGIRERKDFMQKIRLQKQWREGWREGRWKVGRKVRRRRGAQGWRREKEDGGRSRGVWEGNRLGRKSD